MPEGFDAPPLQITTLHLTVIVTALLLLVFELPYVVVGAWLLWIVLAFRKAIRRDQLVWEFLEERQATR